ncbi:predicted protein [Coccidioides posadasii str. Silveira]|uniref:Predicted protein n=1 Tax=Coccidioides posadasii (strain RMSCC 757 / Silveira) TaxID=443226 RepID=E9DD55_COCPS|nr:predicted protein [Coccidioides posadasii str. Silveira]
MIEDIFRRRRFTPLGALWSLPESISSSFQNFAKEHFSCFMALVHRLHLPAHTPAISHQIVIWSRAVVPQQRAPAPRRAFQHGPGGDDVMRDARLTSLFRVKR